MTMKTNRKFKNVPDEIVFYTNLEKLRKHFRLNKTIIGNFLKWSTLKYARIHNRKQKPILDDIIEIANMYGLRATDLMNPDMPVPKLYMLQSGLQKIAVSREGKPDKGYVRSDLISHVTIILSEHIPVQGTFTNNQIREHLPKHLKKYPIEWKKTRLKFHVVPAIPEGQILRGSTQTYKLIQEISEEILKKAKDSIWVHQS